MIAIELKGISKKFGGVTALDNVSFKLEKGKTLGLVGGNGSGKTTLLNSITKMVAPDRGEVYFKGKRIDKLPAYRIARLGIGRIFQTGGVFKNMTVLENLLVASDGKRENEAERILKEVALLEKKGKKAATLSGGQQRLLEFGRVMVRNDELILLDEPFAGVSAENSRKIESVIKKLQEEGKTIILIEHDSARIKRLCNQIIELEKGSIIRRE
ncbi:MAG: ATP-binding cassette domain-containing protein [Candidatus Diapherotrites archaeon]|nr:ATP-binding cassette domain-containing protein [Candidatus Diapherotrites archaeon]